MAEGDDHNVKVAYFWSKQHLRGSARRGRKWQMSAERFQEHAGDILGILGVLGIAGVRDKLHRERRSSHNSCKQEPTQQVYQRSVCRGVWVFQSVR